jgi:hypothetical protein
MLYFDILPEDINILIESKLNYDIIANLSELYDINYKQLLIFKYSLFYKTIYTAFNNTGYKINYEELYKDLLLFKSPPAYLDEKDKKEIIHDYNLVVSKNIFKFNKYLKVFISTTTLNLFNIMDMYKYNDGIINRLKLYPQFVDTPSILNNIIISWNSSKSYHLKVDHETQKFMKIIQKYLVTGIINEVIIFSVPVIESIDNASFYHLLYLLMKENKLEYFSILNSDTDSEEVEYFNDRIDNDADVDPEDDLDMSELLFYNTLKKYIHDNI